MYSEVVMSFWEMIGGAVHWAVVGLRFIGWGASLGDYGDFLGSGVGRCGDAAAFMRDGGDCALCFMRVLGGDNGVC